MAAHPLREQFITHIPPTLESANSRKGIRAITVEQDTPVLVADAFPLTIEESEGFLRIVMETAKINRHYELFLLLQGEVQRFIPHQILISAWVDFHSSNLKCDVISPIPGVRTGKVNGCGIEQMLKDLFTRWVVNGQRKMLFNNADAKPITSSPCNCTFHAAMRGMRSILVHGVHDERDDTDCIYVALNPDSIAKGKSLERFFRLVDPLVTQIDVAFRRVATLKSAVITASENASPRSVSLSALEREIMRCVTEGRTRLIAQNRWRSTTKKPYEYKRRLH